MRELAHLAELTGTERHRRRAERESGAILVLQLLEDLTAGVAIREDLRVWLLEGLGEWLQAGDADLEQLLGVRGAPAMRRRLSLEGQLRGLGHALGARPGDQAKNVAAVLRGDVHGRRLLATLPIEQRQVAEALRRSTAVPSSERHLARLFGAERE